MPKSWLGWLLLSSVFWGCSPASKEIQPGATLRIVCTTGMIADAVHHIGGELVSVEALMGPGVDPHMYKATQKDLEKLTEANLIFYNGLNLEGKLGEVLSRFGREKEVVAISDGLHPSHLLVLEEYGDAIDPHIWFDLELWQEVVVFIAGVMAEQVPEHAMVFEERATAYNHRLDSLHQWAQQKMESIPLQHRFLVTGHDAFGYFGRTYGLPLIPLQGLSTASEFGLRDVTNLVNDVVEEKIRAVFPESTLNPRMLDAVVQGAQQRGHTVKLGGMLHSDALGPVGTPEATFLGMFASNVNTIYEGLQ